MSKVTNETLGFAIDPNRLYLVKNLRLALGLGDFAWRAFRRRTSLKSYRQGRLEFCWGHEFARAVCSSDQTESPKSEE